MLSMPAQDDKRGADPHAAHKPVLQSASPPPAHPKGPARKRRGQDGCDWDWEKLLADDPKIMDTVWSFISMAQLAHNVPVESRQAVLDCEFTFWTQSEPLNTTRCAVLFNRSPGVPIVSSSFTYYRDVFLFALAVRWNVNVARFDLVPEQSQVAFAFVATK